MYVPPHAPPPPQEHPMIAQIDLEHARLEQERLHGLSGRRTLPRNAGMLFYMDPGSYPLFWSRGCYIYLDLAFIDNEHRITQIERLNAFPERYEHGGFSNQEDELFFRSHGITSSHPISYVLEVNAGFFQERGITVGNWFYWNNSRGYFSTSPLNEPLPLNEPFYPPHPMHHPND